MEKKLKCVIGQEIVQQPGGLKEITEGTADSVYTCVGLVCFKHLRGVQEALSSAVVRISNEIMQGDRGSCNNGRVIKQAKVELKLK
jgi:hypothetical protein